MRGSYIQKIDFFFIYKIQKFLYIFSCIIGKNV